MCVCLIMYTYFFFLNISSHRTHYFKDSVLVIYCWATNYCKIQQFKTANIYYLIVFVGEESEHSVTRCWLSVSRRWQSPYLQKLQPSQGLLCEGCACKLTHVASRSLLAVFVNSFLPRGPPPSTSLNVVVCFLSKGSDRERERSGQRAGVGEEREGEQATQKLNLGIASLLLYSIH